MSKKKPVPATPVIREDNEASLANLGPISWVRHDAHRSGTIGAEVFRDGVVPELLRCDCGKMGKADRTEGGTGEVI